MLLPQTGKGWAAFNRNSEADGCPRPWSKESASQATNLLNTASVSSVSSNTPIGSSNIFPIGQNSKGSIKTDPIGSGYVNLR